MTISQWEGMSPQFRPSEFRCKCGHSDCQSTGEEMEYDFMRRLYAVRMELDQTLYVSSGVRCPLHPLSIARVSRGERPSTHTLALAADISNRRDTDGLRALWQECERHGFGGLGSYPDMNDMFIHADGRSRGYISRWMRTAGNYKNLFLPDAS